MALTGLLLAHVASGGGEGVLEGGCLWVLWCCAEVWRWSEGEEVFSVFLEKVWRSVKAEGGGVGCCLVKVI